MDYYTSFDDDALAGISRSVALDDYDELSDSGDEVQPSDETAKTELLPVNKLPSYVIWAPLIQEHLNKPGSTFRLEMRSMLVGVGRLASNIVEALVPVESTMTINGALLLPGGSVKSPNWSSLTQLSSRDPTNFIHTRDDMMAAVGLFRTAGSSQLMADSLSQFYPAPDGPQPTSIAYELLDGCLRLTGFHQLVIFEVLPSSRYTGDRSPSDLMANPLVRVLHTSMYEGPDLYLVEHLEPPNLIPGLSGDLISRAEMLGISATLLVCYSDAPASDIFREAYPVLQRLVARCQHIAQRTRAETMEVFKQLTRLQQHDTAAGDNNLYI